MAACNVAPWIGRKDISGNTGGIQVKSGVQFTVRASVGFSLVTNVSG